jgi:hypothetical protein
MGQVKVASYTYKSASGKTVKVKPFTYNSKTAKGLTKNRKPLTDQQKKQRRINAKIRRRKLKI